MTTLRERVLREIEQERIQSEIRKNIAEAKKIELEHQSIQSEIKRNYADAKRMLAEARYFNRSKIRNVMKYSIAGVITSFLIFHFALDTFKILYESKRYEGEILRGQKKELEEQGQKIEKQYLEILIKDASIHAYGAYKYRVMEDILYNEKRSKEKARFEACQLLHEYWKLVIKIATAKEHLFYEMKQKLAAELKEGEENDICPEECRTENQPMFLSPIRRKSLDLIELHVAQVRAGNSQLPKNLINTLMEQLESQEFDN